jgi:hypothetical protein
LQVLEHEQEWTLGREPPNELREVPQQAGLEIRRLPEVEPRVDAKVERGEQARELGLPAARDDGERRRVHRLERRQ